MMILKILFICSKFLGVLLLLTLWAVNFIFVHQILNPFSFECSL